MKEGSVRNFKARRIVQTFESKNRTRMNVMGGGGTLNS